MTSYLESYDDKSDDWSGNGEFSWCHRRRPLDAILPVIPPPLCKASHHIPLISSESEYVLGSEWPIIERSEDHNKDGKQRRDASERARRRQKGDVWESKISEKQRRRPPRGGQGGCQKYDADRTQELGWNGKCRRQNVFIWRQPSAICSLQVLSWQHDNERLAGALLFNYRLLTKQCRCFSYHNSFNWPTSLLLSLQMQLYIKFSRCLAHNF